jgi:hypothetical protein
VAARSKAWFYGRSLAGTTNSNPAGGMYSYVCVLWVLCVVKWRSLRRAYHLSRGVLPIVVCLSVIEEIHRGGLDPLGMSNHEHNISTAGWQTQGSHYRFHNYWRTPYIVICVVYRLTKVYVPNCFSSKSHQTRNYIIYPQDYILLYYTIQKRAWVSVVVKVLRY